jgi:hypothetical protein
VVFQTFSIVLGGMPGGVVSTIGIVLCRSTADGEVGELGGGDRVGFVSHG